MCGHVLLGEPMLCFLGQGKVIRKKSKVDAGSEVISVFDRVFN